MMESMKERPSKTKKRSERTRSPDSPTIPSTSQIAVDPVRMQVLVKRVENLEIHRDDEVNVDSKAIEILASEDSKTVDDRPMNEEDESKSTTADIREESPASEISSTTRGDFENVVGVESEREDTSTIESAPPSTIPEEPIVVEEAPPEEITAPILTESVVEDIAALAAARPSIQLYPEINRIQLQELVDEARPIETPKPAIRTKESAPPMRLELEPLTEMQLRSFYHNPELERVDDFEDEFLENTVRPIVGDEFFALVQTYLDACRRVEQLQLDAHDLSQRWDSARRNVWLMEKVVKKEQGHCGEGRSASGAYTIERAKFQENCFGELKNLAQKRRHLRIVQLAFASHQSKTSELQCKHFICSILQSYRNATGITTMSPSFIRFDNPPAQLASTRYQIRNCMTVLFYFLRQPVTESVFMNSCRSWLNDLCGNLLRHSFVDDHLFLLSHVLRCPNGVGVWAPGYVQPACHLNSMIDSDRAVDHFLAMLSVCLNPIRRREDYLKSFISPEVINTWTIVDADGEEERELVAISEADLLSILNQFSFDQLFSAWFQNMQQSELTEPKILRLFAFELTILRVLFDGIRAYNALQYKQLCKQLGYVMRQSVQYVAEFWQYFKNQQTDPSLCDRLQLEFDRLVLYTVYYGVSSKGLGVWQFLADLPYGDISVEFQWRIIDLLLSPASNGVSPRDLFGKPTEAIQEEMKDAKVLELRLHDLDQMDATYLLTALSNMACAAQDVTLVQTISTILFTACFERPSTREIHHKTGRELIRSVAERHTWLMSYLLSLVEARMDYLGGYALELFDHLPRHLWSLSESDWNTLRSWLFQPLASLKSTLAQRILLGCNWGQSIEQPNRLFLAAFLHRQVAEAVVKTYDDLCPVQAGLISGSIKKASKMASSVSGQLSVEQQFMEFCWQLLLRLKLHPFDSDITDDDSYGGADENADLFERAKKGNPLAAFVAFQLSVRSAESVIQIGLGLLEQLLSNYFVKPAIVCVTYGLRFLANSEGLQNDERWTRCFDATVHIDDTYYHYAKTLVVGNFAGENLAYLASNLSEVILALATKRQWDASKFVDYIVRLCCNSNSKPWNSDRATVYLLDRLIEASFLNDPSMTSVIEILRIGYETVLAQHRGSKSGMLSMFRGEKSIPPLVASTYFHDHPWLSYCAIKVEETAFRTFYRTLTLELMRHPAYTLEHCLKKASSKTNTQMTIDRLVPFMYADLASSMDAGHPLLPLVFQGLCFAMYERIRIPEEPSLAAICFGTSFSRNDAFSGKVATLKKGIQTYIGQSKSDASDSQGGDSRTELFKAVCSWLSDSRLIDPMHSSIPPGTPMPHALQGILNGNRAPWLEFVDFTLIRSTVEKRGKDWTKTRYGDAASNLPQPPPHPLAQTSALHRLFERLKNADRHNLVPPPEIGSLDAVFYTPDLNTLLDENQMVGIVESLMQNFFAAASDFNDMQKSVLSLDDVFFEQLKKLYTDVNVQVSVILKCHRTCGSPNNMKVAAKSSKLLDNVQNSLDQNRVTWTDTIDNISALVAYNIPQHCVSLYAIVRQLTRVYAEGDNLAPDARNRLKRMGVKLFHKFVGAFNDRIAEFPPTKALFNATIEHLGMAFILRNPDEIERLMELLPGKLALFSSLLNLLDSDCASNDAFQRIYTRICGWIEAGALNANSSVECLKRMNVRNALQRFRSTEISRLNQEIVRGCCAAKSDSLAGVLTILRNHWTESFAKGLPSNFQPSLDALLKACDRKALPPVLFDDFVAGLNSEHASGGSHLVPAVYAEVVAFLSEYFSTIKSKCSECTNYGLYHCWDAYAGKIWPLLSICFVRSILNPEAYSTPAEGLRHCFSVASRLFGPWIEADFVGGQTRSPWALDVDSTANKFVQSFVDSLLYLHRLYAGESEQIESVCGLALEWYVGKVSPNMEHLGGYVWRSYHSHLLRLPWQTYRPTIMSLEALKQMTRDKSLSAPFATSLIVRLPWTAFLQSLTQMPPSVRSTAQGLVLNILVRCAGNEMNYADCKASFPELLQSMASSNWSSLDLAAMEESSIHIMHVYDCQCILRGDDQRSADGGILRVFATACFFTSSPSSSDDHDLVTQKRMRFIRLLVALSVRCSRYPGVPSSSIVQFFVGLIGRIDSLLLLKHDSSDQTAAASQMMSEVLLFLNQANKSLFDDCITGFGNWLVEHPDSLLCLVSIQSYARVAVNPTLWLAVSEKCIAAHFLRPTPPPTWSEVLEKFTVKEAWTSTMKTECQQRCEFLSLYAFWNTRLRMRKELTEETLILRNSIETLKMANEKQLPEAPSVLLIGLALHLLVRQVQFGAGTSSVVAFVRELSSTLQNAAEGKTGILSTLGLSKKISYSSRFQLLCLLVANFLEQQLIDDDRGKSTGGGIRLRQASVITNPRVQWTQNLRSNKQYSSFAGALEAASSFFSDSRMHFEHVVKFYARVASALFAERYVIDQCTSYANY